MSKKNGSETGKEGGLISLVACLNFWKFRYLKIQDKRSSTHKDWTFPVSSSFSSMTDRNGVVTTEPQKADIVIRMCNDNNQTAYLIEPLVMCSG